MTEPWTPRPTTAEPAPAAEGSRDELEVLDQLEADLAAVEQAIAGLDRVASEGLGGEAAADQIAAAVSVDRFGGPVTDPG